MKRLPCPSRPGRHGEDGELLRDVLRGFAWLRRLVTRVFSAVCRPARLNRLCEQRFLLASGCLPSCWSQESA